ncbi:hypothetical protein B0T26DRAFT_28856 [Lasiosphaeria miniovina]|uniref:Uncharacterized protein n=1 Tax=Lasiosphaeria miniovina TaxID=1954250 RepID=A0AA40EDN0_9PEZI|nr:uncharacterized protein B0T26DRAFT_28856 [Lasiosphaeria miniovina]KAK0733611.1 hypothetical protein B0T26DRAFT_28856 [Lasiosphaeria miniovina]
MLGHHRACKKRGKYSWRPLLRRLGGGCSLLLLSSCRKRAALQHAPSGRPSRWPSRSEFRWQGRRLTAPTSGRLSLSYQFRRTNESHLPRGRHTARKGLGGQHLGFGEEGQPKKLSVASSPGPRVPQSESWPAVRAVECPVGGQRGWACYSLSLGGGRSTSRPPFVGRQKQPNTYTCFLVRQHHDNPKKTLECLPTLRHTLELYLAISNTELSPIESTGWMSGGRADCSRAPGLACRRH